MNIKEIDPKHIDKNGVFINMNKRVVRRLSDTEILMLRKYYKNENIGINRKIDLKSEIPVNFIDKTNKKRKYKIAMEKFPLSKAKMKKMPKKSNSLRLIVGGIVVSIFILGSFESLKAVSEKFEENQQSKNDYIPINPISYSSVKAADSNQSDEVMELGLNNDEIDEKYAERKKLIKSYCNIYQIDFDIAYSIIEELTDDFSNENYLKGHIEGVTCKGKEVYANSEEELLFYIVRCLKLQPNNLGISDDFLFEHNLYKKNGYESSEDYITQLDFVSKIVGVDRRLLYAIVETECGFNNIMFEDINNPARIYNKKKGNYWVFDTKEEGFFQLAVEIKEYYCLIGEDPVDINYDILSKIKDLHAPGNDYWLTEVVDKLEYAQLNEAELFGDVIDNYSTIKM